MALFNFEKKKEEKRRWFCTCNGDGDVIKEDTKGVNDCCSEAVNGIYCIKVLGSGCRNCHNLLEAAKAAVKSRGLTVEVEYVTDMEKVMEYGVMSIPALVVNEQVVSVGRVLKASDIEKLLCKEKM